MTPQEIIADRMFQNVLDDIPYELPIMTVEGLRDAVHGVANGMPVIGTWEGTLQPIHIYKGVVNGVETIIIDVDNNNYKNRFTK